VSNHVHSIKRGDCRGVCLLSSAALAQHARPGSSRFLLHLERAYLASTPNMIAATPSAKKS
jgi:hypothetical protein